MLRCLLLCILAVLPLAAGADPVAPQQVAIAPSLKSTMQLSPNPNAPLEVTDDLPKKLKTIDLTTPPDDLWQRVRNGFSMPNLDSPLVADREAWYLNRPEMLKSILFRSRRYIYYIVGELQKRGMPTELALLPVVESAYNPMAYSRARASGIWQFIPSTGKNYRLEQNWWFDQRRDIIASTTAALDYLQAIYDMYGDWHLALAAYNCGENAVARAIAKNQALGLPTDYANLDLPSETRYYVPKLQAIKNIIANPELFGITLDAIPNKPYFDAVGKPADMDVSLAAKLAETSIEEFKALNPSYNRPVMPARKGSPLLLPTGKVQIFLANLATYEEEEKPLSTWHTYRLQRRERLAHVAARFHLSLAHLEQINGITRRTRIHPGTTLLVPGHGSQASLNLRAVNVPETPSELPRKKSVKGEHAVAKAGKHAVVRKRHVVAAKKHAVVRKGHVVAAKKHVVARKRHVVAARKHVVVRRRHVVAKKKPAVLRKRHVVAHARKTAERQAN